MDLKLNGIGTIKFQGTHVLHKMSESFHKKFGGRGYYLLKTECDFVGKRDKKQQTYLSLHRFCGDFNVCKLYNPEIFFTTTKTCTYDSICPICFPEGREN